MLTVPFVTTALVIAVLVGSALTVWLWTARRQQLVTAGGLRALAAMRWREFSRFVIEALQAQGFEASRIAPDAGRGQEADLLLNRDGQTWLLSCKQGVNYRIDSGMVDELARAVRGSNARGGILATLGRIAPEARTHNQGIELLDGATLWPLIDPLLPPSLHRELTDRARALTMRTIALGWVGAIVLGMGLATLLPTASEAAPEPTMADAPVATPVIEPPAAATATPEAPVEQRSEQEQRVEIERSVSVLPGVEHASWATRSTLLVQLLPNASEAQIDAICTVVERSVALGASRLQLQPPAGSDSPVRFVQCRAF